MFAIVLTSILRVLSSSGCGEGKLAALQRCGFVIYLIHGNQREDREAHRDPLADYREVQADVGEVFRDSARVYVPQRLDLLCD